MDVGVTMAFQSAFNDLTDQQVYQNELEVALMAEPMGFDSVWTTEHHFTDYEMIPSPTQFLSFMAGATKRLKLGSMVIVVPWHDPYRVAAEITLLENLSGGRMILGLGRGLARAEFTRFRIPVEESRGRFNEHVTAVLDSLETGTFELDGTYVKQPASPLRPRPIRSFAGRTFFAGNSPETMPLAAKLGAGMLLIPATGWDEMIKNVRAYEEFWEIDRPGQPRPRPLAVAFTYVDKDAGRAEELARKHISNYWRSVVEHYEFAAPQRFDNVKGYEHYKSVAAAAADDTDKFVNEFVDQMIWGTPEQVIERTADLRTKIDLGHLICHFTYSSLPHEDAKASMKLFADEVLPVLHTWPVEPVVSTEELASARS